MSDISEEAGTAAPRHGGRLLALAGGAALLLASAGFWAAQQGLLDEVVPGVAFPARGPSAGGAAASAATTSFVPLEPITVSLAPDSPQRLLRLRVELEVHEGHAAEVARLSGRVIDVMNTYLRALDSHTLSEPAALLLLRSQLLRRARIVTGEGRIADLLILEFVLH